MKKMGVFLGFGHNIQIKTEGIGRLIGFLVKGNLENDDQKVIVAMPEWFRSNFMELLEDQEISKEKIEILTTKRIPYGIKIFEHYKKIKSREKKEKQGIVRIILEKCRCFVNDETYQLMTTRSTGKFVLRLAFLGIVSLMMIPLLVVLSIIKLVTFGVKKVTNPLSKFAKSSVTRIFKWIYSNGEVSLSAPNKLHDKIVTDELSQLVKIVNQRKDIESWFIPSMFWPEIKGIKAKKVMAAPDVVYYDFPTQFAGEAQDLVHDKIIKSINAADHVICYSNFVKQEHINKKCGIPLDKISVIEHAHIDMQKYLNVKDSIKEYISEKRYAIEIIEKYIALNSSDYWMQNIEFSSLKYIIYSSQDRPHKNILNLIKAIDILNKEKHENIKLILTGHIKYNTEIMKYIAEAGMKKEIIQFSNLPSKVLAAFNKLAICAVNPTLFEGGFPFTFTEAYSVGTPSIMSDIPVINEKIRDEKLQKQMLFDPYDAKDIAKKIEWGIENSIELYEKQDNLYSNFKKRSWNNVAKEYFEVINS